MVCVARKRGRRAKLARGRLVARESGVHAGAEHLPEIGPRHPARRYVEDVRLRPELGVEGQRDLFFAHHVVHGVGGVFLPAPVGPDLDQALQPDLADAGGHAARLHRQAVGQRVAALDTGVAGDALLRSARGRAVYGLLVRASLHALAIAAAALLGDEDDAVLRALVDRLTGAGGGG